MKNQSKPKAKSFKKPYNKKPSFNKKYEEEIVDYFPRDADENDGLVFNKAPVYKESLGSSKKSTVNEKRKRTKESFKSLFDDAENYEGFDSEEDMPDSKKVKKDLENEFLDDYGGLLGSSQNFIEFFMANSSNFKTKSKVGNFKFTEGSLILASVCDKGPGGKYLVVNIGRNKRGYVSFNDISQKSTSAVKHFEKGEYIVGMTLASNQKKVQLTLKPSFLNRNITFADMHINQIIPGYLKDKEDYGYLIDFCTEDEVKGFLRFPEVEGLKFNMDRPYLFIITGKNDTTNMVDCQIMHHSLSFDNNSITARRSSDDNETAALESLASAGNLVNCIVKKVLENGLLVNFVSVFYGFIFTDHLQNPLNTYKNGDKFKARIIATDWESKQINLSNLDCHVNMNTFSPQLTIGTSFSTATVSEAIYGGSYFLDLKTADSDETYKGFLHKTHLIKNKKNEVPEYKPGDEIDHNLILKDYNYFEHYFFVSAKEEETKGNINVHWDSIKVGDIHTGTITKIIDMNPQKMKILVSLNKFVNGTVDFLNLSEIPNKSTVKGIKEKKEVKVRVLGINKERKSIYLTMKPSLLDTKINILKDFNADPKLQYVGYIVSVSEKGYIVSFFNDISGYLPFAEFEANLVKKEDFVLGQPIRVHIKFIDAEKKKIGLTLSSKSQNESKNKAFDYESVESLNQFDVVESDLDGNDVYEYKVNRKKSAINDNYLVLQSTKLIKGSTGNYVEHTAILPKTHLSDYESNYEKLFNHYKIQQNATFNAKIFDLGNNVIVTIKPSLVNHDLPQSLEDVKEKAYYYGCVENCIHTGIKVKLSGSVIGILSSNKLPEDARENFTEFFSPDKTIKVLVNKVKADQNKLYFEFPDSENSREDFFFTNYLEEEYSISQTKINNSSKVWSHYKIGNYVKVRIDMIKEYGIIVKLQDRLAGLLVRSNLLNDYDEYKVGQNLICRILDLDYEKNIIDLCEENVTEEKFESTLKNKLDYNRDKIIKSGLPKTKKESLGATILLVKDNYLVVKLIKHPKILALVQCKKFNDSFDSHQKFDIHTTIKFKHVNAQDFDQNKIVSETTFKKSNSALIGAIWFAKKGEEENVEAESTPTTGRHIKKNLRVGLLLSGKITKKSKNNVFVELGQNLFGRVHKSQFDYDPVNNTTEYDSFSTGDEIKCKVLTITKVSHLYVELTCLSEHLNLAGEELNQSYILTELNADSIGKKFNAVVKSVSAKSLNPLYLELTNTIVGHANAFDGIVDPQNTNITDQIEVLNNIESRYNVGDIVQVWIKQVEKKAIKEHDDVTSAEVTLYQPAQEKITKKKSQIAVANQEEEGFQVGQLVVCRLCKILKRGVRVQYGREAFGFVDIMELYDEFYAYPLKKIEEKLNCFILGRIIAFSVAEEENAKQGNEIFLSLRESVLNPTNWKVISPEGSTLQFKKKLGYQEDNGDLRSRIYKLGMTSIKPNQVFVGYVTQTNDKGCFVRLTFNVSGRAAHKELSDVNLLNSSSTFFENRLVMGRILGIREDGKIDITLRENPVKFGYVVDESVLRPGLIVRAVVSGFTKSTAILSIIGSKHTATLKPEEVNTDGKPIEKALPVGTSLLTKIKQIDRNAKPIRIRVTCRITEEELNNPENIHEVDTTSSAKIVALHDSIKSICEEYTKGENYSNINPELIKNIEESKIQEETEQALAAENGLQTEDQAEEEGDEDEGEQVDEEQNGVDEEGIDEEDEEQQQDGEDEIREDQDVLSDEEKDDDLLFLSNKSKGTKRKEIEKMKLETEIREREMRLLNENEQEFKSSDDYEKLLLKNPNSSYIWIQFVAFEFERKGIEKARNVMERAIRAIMFRSENERINLWTAYINLEYRFGNEDSLLKAFEKAKNANNPKKIYLKLIDLYRKDKKWELVEEFSKAMIKKHKNSAKAWIAHMQNTVDILKSRGAQNLDLAEIVSRALQSLHKRKHLKILCQHALILFKNGEIERGRTTFEAIVSNYPKRTDIWNVYIDMEIKYGNKESVRNLIERCLTLDLGAKKMKFFFKKYMKFEMDNGDSHRVEIVKKKAEEYVQSLINKENEGSDEEGDENEN